VLPPICEPLIGEGNQLHRYRWWVPTRATFEWAECDPQAMSPDPNHPMVMEIITHLCDDVWVNVERGGDVLV
jgi:hypothetical protein